MKFSGSVANGPVNKWLYFDGDPDRRLDTVTVFRIRHYWEIRKVVNGHSLILIRHMAALVRRALAEICTFPVLLVYHEKLTSEALRLGCVNKGSYSFTCHPHIYPEVQ